jgi:hypothetical protein
MAEYETGTLATQETATALDRDQKNIVKVVLEKIAKKQPIIDRYERYYRGNHPLNFASDRFTTEFAQRLKSFRDNLCPTCVQAPADRLEVIGFAADATSQVYKTSWDIWKYSQMPKEARNVHRDAFKTGDGFVVVWLDSDGRARIWRQDPGTCTVIYDMEKGVVDIGAKLWRGVDNFVYLTIYFRDRVEKYITKNTQSAGNVPTTGSAFERRNVQGESWPLANDTGICPMFHFGRETSILADVIPLNDALNKSIADMLVGSEANSLLQRWVSGIAYEINPETGKQIIPFDDFATWFAAQDATAKFGAFPQIDTGKMLETIKDFRTEIAGVAGIPPYYFGQDAMNIPSGEALRKLESRFTSLVKDGQLDFGETWAAAVKFALDIDGKSVGDGEGSQLETRWTPAAPLSDNENADLVSKKKAIGISSEKALSELGYSDAEITQMSTENQAAAKANADAFSKVFDAGSTLAGGAA